MSHADDVATPTTYPSGRVAVFSTNPGLPREIVEFPPPDAAGCCLSFGQPHAQQWVGATCGTGQCTDYPRVQCRPAKRSECPNVTTLRQYRARFGDTLSGILPRTFSGRFP